MIISGNNINFINAKKLHDKKYRDNWNLFLIEGEKLIKDAIRFNFNIESIFVDVNKKNKYQNILNNDNLKILEIEEKFMDKLSDSKTPQGIIAVCHKPQYDICKPKGNALIMENIQDPQNVGAILRTAAALDYNDIYVCDCADVYSMKCMRSGMSSQFLLRIYDTNITTAIELNNCNSILCADMHGIDIESYKKTNKKTDKYISIILGNEGQGISQISLNACNEKISIPMKNDMESLNVAVSAGIIMYTFMKN